VELVPLSEQAVDDPGERLEDVDVRYEGEYVDVRA